MAVHVDKNSDTTYKELKNRLAELTPVFINAAMGDFTKDVKLPPKDDELAEVFVGVQVMLDVIRDQIKDLTRLNRHIQRSAKVALKESDDRFRLVTRATSDVVYDLDLKYDTSWFNEALHTEYGYPRDEKTNVIDWWATHVHPEDAMRVNDELSAALESDDRTWTSEYRFKKHDGTYIEVRDRAFIMRDQKGKPIRIIGSLLDITQQKELERAKDEFISLVSHQLRTPLTSIRLFTEMIADGQVGKLTDGQQDYINKVHDSTNRMIHLVGDMLNISHIELGRLKVEPVLTDMNELLGWHIEEVKPFAETKGLEIKFTPKQNMPPVSVDPILFSQIVHNLLTNAIRYSDPGAGEIKVVFRKTKTCYELSVSDNGIGIPDSVQPRMFNSFFRADNAIKIQGEGSGLGLYLIKLIMDSTGGKVWYKSILNKGSTFYVSIPLEGMHARSGDKTLS